MLFDVMYYNIWCCIAVFFGNLTLKKCKSIEEANPDLRQGFVCPNANFFGSYLAYQTDVMKVLSP